MEGLNRKEQVRLVLLGMEGLNKVEGGGMIRKEIDAAIHFALGLE